MATTKKTGRPSDYLPEVAADICSLLADGESLQADIPQPKLGVLANKAYLLKRGDQAMGGGNSKSDLKRQIGQRYAVTPRFRDALKQQQTAIKGTGSIARLCLLTNAVVFRNDAG